MRVSQGFWGTREHEPIFREQGNKTLQIWGRKHCKQIHYKGNKYGKRTGAWEHRASLEGNKGTRTSLPGRPSYIVILATIFKVAGYFSAEYVSLEEHTKKTGNKLERSLVPFHVRSQMTQMHRSYSKRLCVLLERHCSLPSWIDRGYLIIFRILYSECHHSQSFCLEYGLG